MIIRFRLSLSQRLLVGLLVVSFACFAVIAGLTIRDTINETYELFDAHLAQTALALLRVTDPDDDDPHVIPRSVESPSLNEIFSQWPDLPERLASAGSVSGNPQGQGAAPQVSGESADPGSIHSLHVEYEKKLRYQIWTRDGRLLLRSSNAPDVAMTGLDGFSEITDSAGQTWRYYGVWDRHHDFRVLVSEAHDVRNRLVRSIALHLASPLALGLPVLIFLLWLSISRGLNPLGTLTREIEKRKPENLMPLDAASAPGEVRPMVLALNELLRRMTHTLESERLFTANAAHELRTPLAAIQAQLHAARAADGGAERQRAMDQLQLGVERGIRLVGQLLTLARLDPEQALPDAQPVDMGCIAQEVCAQLAPLALQREQTLELEIEPDLPLLPGNADMLSMLIGNLVDNAIRYTQRSGDIKIAIRRQAADIVLEVSDDGPGIPAAQRLRVFERFYRLAGQDQPGTGLGLAICRRIAELHKAQIHLADGPDGIGLSVSVLLRR
ncbi:MAG: ATP-binding protein [Proteobacteria bacterium]|nr:ATP-binding protein [Pseudomonadota bacterium]